jgi:hypothetical protein
MPTNIQLTTEFIPYEDGLYVARLRKWLNDTAILNKLEELEECEDIELYHYIQDTMDEINYEFLPATSYTAISEIPWNITRQGAILKLLMAKGILSARNTLTYQDSGGVTVQDYDKYGRYINFFNLLINKYSRAVHNFKLASNIDDCYGGVHSEYGIIHGEDIYDE